MKRLAGALAAVALAVSLTACTDSFRDSCVAQGGTVDSHTDVGTGVGYSSKGGPVIVTTTSTTRYCLVDGKIVGID